MTPAQRLELLFSFESPLRCWDYSWFLGDDYFRSRGTNFNQPGTLHFIAHRTQEHATSLRVAANILYERHRICLRTAEPQWPEESDRWKTMYEVCIGGLIDLMKDEIELSKNFYPLSPIHGLQSYLYLIPGPKVSVSTYRL